MISVTPTTVTSPTLYTISASNAFGTASISLSIHIISPFISYPQVSFTISEEIHFSVTPTFIVNVTISIISGSLPLGLILNPSSGVISGTPSQSVTSLTVTIKAENAVSNRSYSLLFTVIIPISSFDYPQSSYLIPRGQQFTSTPSVSGYNPSYSITSGSLPTGLVLDSLTGTISGTPSQSISAKSVTIKAENEASDQSFTLSFTVRITPSSLQYPQSIYYLPTNTSFITIPQCEGDNLSFQIQSGTLPSGHSLDSSTGTISGTPVTSTVLLMVTVLAFNEMGSTQSSLSIQIQTPLSNLHYPQLSYVLVRGEAFSTLPVILGDTPLLNMNSGTLPDGLVLNSISGEISGIPTIPCTVSLIIYASNKVGSIETSVSFVVKALSTSTIVLICVGVVAVIILIIILVIASKRKRHSSFEVPE